MPKIITKPVNVKQLEAGIAKLVDRKSQLAAMRRFTSFTAIDVCWIYSQEAVLKCAASPWIAFIPNVSLRMGRLICLLLGCAFLQHTSLAGAESRVPVWLLGNGFHTSLVFRARDIPYLHDITGSRDADEIAIGWGASADYRGPSTPWTVLQAIYPNHGALHIVPIHGPIARRFPHSDLVLLWLKPQGFSTLVSEIDRSFAITRDHHRILLGRGYFPDSRFYASSERFYFPYVCNEWVAIKLSRAGVPFFLPRALLSNSLILQASEKGALLQRHGRGFDAY